MELIAIVDPETKDEDCRSIQSILGYVISAGYNYAIQIRISQGEVLSFKKSQRLLNIKEYQRAIELMFAYNVDLFSQYPNLKLEENNSVKKMIVTWGQLYDVEQLFEHAIVHILRHRRQIERFLNRLRTSAMSGSAAMRFDFNDKYFALVENSEQGTVDRSTTFHFRQKGDLITAIYFGGTVRYGTIVAQLLEGQLVMRYQCLTYDNEFKVGKALAKVSHNGEGKIVLNLDWEWIGNPNTGTGKSTYIEV